MLDAIAVRRRRRRSTALQVVASNIVPEGTALPRSTLPFRPYFHTAVSKLRKRVGRCASWSIRKPSQNGFWRNGLDFRDSTARNHRNHAGPWTGQNRTKNMGVHFAQLKKPKHLRSKVASSSARHNTWGENASSLGTSALFLYYTQSQNIIV